LHAEGAWADGDRSNIASGYVRFIRWLRTPLHTTIAERDFRQRRGDSRGGQGVGRRLKREDMLEQLI
jgi:hypothetical protein